MSRGIEEGMSNDSARYESVSTIVIGGLNTDIIGKAVPRLLGSGEMGWGGSLEIGPGGKSRNIAQMIAMLSPPGRVAMIGKTAEDPWGLFRYPLDALCHAGVDTSFVRVLPREAGRLPGIALIPVDRNGCNQIYVLPGVNDEFGPEDVRLAEPLFSAARANRGFLVLSLECPFPTVLFARKLAREHQLRTLLDPGGMSIGQSYDDLLACGLFLIKPNRHETSLLTGIEVTDMPSARRAAERLFDRGIQNVMITMGEQGAYLFQTDGGQSEHIPAPSLLPTSVRDETGCGDQTLAALVAAIHSGKSMSQAARIGVTAGTWQYTRLGIDPLDRAELNLRLENDLKLPEPRDQP